MFPLVHNPLALCSHSGQVRSHPWFRPIKKMKFAILINSHSRIFFLYLHSPSETLELLRFLCIRLFFVFSSCRNFYRVKESARKSPSLLVSFHSRFVTVDGSNWERKTYPLAVLPSISFQLRNLIGTECYLIRALTAHKP